MPALVWLEKCQTIGSGPLNFQSLTCGWWRGQFISQVGIVILLLGTLIGGIIQVGEGFGYGLTIVSSPPGWLINGSGR